MTENSGLNIEDAQRAICKGTYGGKEWSAEERQAACLKLNEVYEPNVTGSHVYLNVALIVIGVLFAAGIVMLYTKLKQRRSLPPKDKTRGAKKDQKKL